MYILFVSTKPDVKMNQNWPSSIWSDKWVSRNVIVLLIIEIDKIDYWWIPILPLALVCMMDCRTNPQRTTSYSLPPILGRLRNSSHLIVMPASGILLLVRVRRGGGGVIRGGDIMRMRANCQLLHIGKEMTAYFDSIIATRDMSVICFTYLSAHVHDLSG